MVEALGTPELTQARAPIHIIYGRHDKGLSYHLDSLDKKIGERLHRYPAGDVAVFVEEASLASADADMIQELSSKEGLPPSTSLVTALFVKITGRKPTTVVDRIIMKGIINDTPPFKQSELSILDKHHQSNRIRLLFESRDDHASMEETDSYYNSLEGQMNSGFFMTAKGYFDKGLDIFIPLVMDFSADTRRRNERLAEKIGNAASEKGVAAVVGFIGSAHTRLGHLLTKRGYTVSREFAGSDGRLYLWDYFSQAIRHFELDPEKKLSELEWYRLIIGSTAYVILDEPLKEEIRHLEHAERERELNRLKNSYMPKLDNMDDVRRFECDVRTRGFEETLRDPQVTAEIQ